MEKRRYVTFSTWAIERVERLRSEQDLELTQTVDQLVKFGRSQSGALILASDVRKHIDKAA